MAERCFVCKKSGADITVNNRPCHTGCMELAASDARGAIHPDPQPESGSACGAASLALPQPILKAHARLKDAIRILSATKEAVKAAKEEHEGASAELARLLDEFASGQTNFLDEAPQ